MDAIPYISKDDTEKDENLMDKPINRFSYLIHRVILLTDLPKSARQEQQKKYFPNLDPNF